MPFLCVCYIVSILDRCTIGCAQLRMRQDLGLTDAMYGLVAVPFFIGCVLLEVPRFEVPSRVRHVGLRDALIE